MLGANNPFFDVSQMNGPWPKHDVVPMAVSAAVRMLMMT